MAARRYEIYLREFFQHKKISFASPSDHVIFFLLYKMFTIHNDVCGDFSKISDHFPKISEDCRRRPKKIRRYFNHTPTTLSVVKSTKDNFSKIISSHVRISYRFLSICYHWVYHCLLYNENDFLTEYNYTPLFMYSNT